MNGKRILVVFYSRTGATLKVAESLSSMLRCDIEEIFDKKNRKGLFGYVRCGMDAAFKRLTVISEVKSDPTLYDVVVVGTPIWASRMSAPIRTYLYQNREHVKKVAFFCTCGGLGNDKAFREMAELRSQKPVAQVEVRGDEISGQEYLPKLRDFDEIWKSFVHE
jgi:flavodoxin